MTGHDDVKIARGNSEYPIQGHLKDVKTTSATEGKTLVIEKTVPAFLGEDTRLTSLKEKTNVHVNSSSPTAVHKDTDSMPMI